MGTKDKIITAPIKAVKSILNLGNQDTPNINLSNIKPYKPTTSFNVNSPAYQNTMKYVVDTIKTGPFKKTEDVDNLITGLLTPKEDKVFYGSKNPRPHNSLRKFINHSDESDQFKENSLKVINDHAQLKGKQISPNVREAKIQYYYDSYKNQLNSIKKVMDDEGISMSQAYDKVFGNKVRSTKAFFRKDKWNQHAESLKTKDKNLYDYFVSKIKEPSQPGTSRQIPELTTKKGYEDYKYNPRFEKGSLYSKMFKKFQDEKNYPALNQLKNEMNLAQLHSLGDTVARGDAKTIEITQRIKKLSSKYEMIPKKYLKEVTYPNYPGTQKINRLQSDIELGPKGGGAGFIDLLVEKYKILGHTFTSGKKAGGNWKYKNPGDLSSKQIDRLKQINKQLNSYEEQMMNNGIEIKFYNPRNDTLQTFGKKDENIIQLINQYKEGNRKDGGLVRPNMAIGGFARRMMAIGGDMSQFTETEEVVSTPDGMEGQVDLAMSFKNPFKIKKPPPLFDESAANLKISGAVDDIKATETITDTNKGIFNLKSETEIMNSPQENMMGAQWLGFLKKKGVSPTELDEFGLGNYLNSNQNIKINKNDLMNAYKDLKPIITYDIYQKEPFKKGADDFLTFLTRRESGGGYYHGTEGVEEIRGLNNKPQDVAGDSARVQLAEIFKATGNDATLMMDQGAETINKIFKQFYGIDNVLKNGIPEGSKIPFYSKNIVERFKRLHSGDGFYMSKKTPKHEGMQFLPGGTGYVEIPITYNPNPKGPRAKEPGYTEGGGHFSNASGNNPVFWMRASERTDEAGRRVLFIEEIQSDLHQGVQQKGKKYAARQDAAGGINISNLNTQRIKLADDLNKITDQIDKVKGHTDPSTQTVLARLQIKRSGIRDQLNEINAQLDKVDKAGDGFPEAPFKKSENQAKVAIKIAINLARENGYDGVVMISGKAKNSGASASGTVAKGNLGFYNNIAAKAMKNAAKNNGLDFSATNIKDGKGNTWAKLPYINIKGTPTKPVDMYKNTGGYIHYPSFVDVVSTL